MRFVVITMVVWVLVACGGEQEANPAESETANPEHFLSDQEKALQAAKDAAAALEAAAKEEAERIREATE